MSIGRTSRCFKFFLIGFVAVILVVLSTRQRISETTQIEHFYEDKSFLNQLPAKNKEKDIYDDLKVERQPANEQAEGAQDEQNDSANNKEDNPEVEEVDDDTQVPFDDTMPGAYLKFLEPAPTNRSYCRYNYDLPYDLVYRSKHYLFPPEIGNRSEYRILYNVTEAYNVQNTTQVTYATHMTANFAYFIPELLKQWDGLVTVAAFVPDLDSAFFLEQIIQYCYCEPEMYRVSIHVVTHKSLPFSKKDIYFDRPDSCIPQDSSKIVIFKEYDETIVYPVNVLRNVARTSALTKYVLLSDIELMPSKGLASGFLQMIQAYNKTNPQEVFVVPIFEVEQTETIPENKEELLKLIEDKKAVYFHGMVCIHCQKFPGIDEWMKSGYASMIKPLVSVKRHAPYHRWEPLFIGTNAEPLYSEKLSWEGLQDKMTQSLEMCLQDYIYTILDNAFLCHWPGIKKQKVAEEEWRATYVEQNKIAYEEIVLGLKQRYKDIPKCKVNYADARLPKVVKKKA